MLKSENYEEGSLPCKSFPLFRGDWFFDWFYNVRLDKSNAGTFAELLFLVLAYVPSCYFGDMILLNSSWPSGRCF